MDSDRSSDDSGVLVWRWGPRAFVDYGEVAVASIASTLVEEHSRGGTSYESVHEAIVRAAGGQLNDVRLFVVFVLEAFYLVDFLSRSLGVFLDA